MKGAWHFFNYPGFKFHYQQF